MTETAVYLYWLAAETDYREASAYTRAHGHAMKLTERRLSVYRGCLIHDERPRLVASYFAMLLFAHEPKSKNALRAARSLEAAGRHDIAQEYFAEAVKLAPLNSDAWYRFGMSIVTVANADGGYTLKKMAEAAESFRRAIELSPHNDGARSQLIRLIIRSGEWPSFDRLPGGHAATEPRPPLHDLLASRTNFRLTSEGQVRQLLSLLALEIPPSREAIGAILAEPTWSLGTGIADHLWFPLHWRLMSLGWYSEAYSLKTLWAETLSLGQGGIGGLPFSRALIQAQADVFLGSFDGAQGILEGLLARSNRDEVRRFLKGFLADLDLLRGSSHRHSQDSLDVPYAHDFSSQEYGYRALISGRNVAVVGPAPDGPSNGTEIDQFDVVVRTRLPDLEHLDVSRFGRRTDVVYPALGRSLFTSRALFRALEEEKLRYIVLRTAAQKSMEFRQFSGRGLRFNPREYAAILSAAQFGIQRIAHDILRYKPAHVKVFASTLFVGAPKLHYSGYERDVRSGRKERGLVRAPDFFAHDHVADFLFLQSLSRSGLIDVDSELERVLGLGLAGYLSALDEQGNGPPVHERTP